MMRSGLLLVSLLLGAAAADAQVHVSRHFDEGGSQGGGAALRDRHAGGPQTLPYGHTTGWDAGIAAHAQTMPAVQHAIRTMAERGYVRRSDGDAAGTRPGYAVAVLAFEKPGAAPSAALPVVVVHTRTYYVNGRVKWVPVTQVACGMFRDSAGVVVPASTPGDSAVLIAAVGGTSDLAPGEIERAMAGGEDMEGLIHTYRWAYTTYELLNNPPTWNLTPGQRYYWEQYGQRVAIPTFVAGAHYGRQWVTPPPFGGGWQGGVYTMAVTAWSAHTFFMMSPPDTSDAYR